MSRTSIEIIIVLYRCTLAESNTFKSLSPILERLNIDYELIIYNNDPSINIVSSNNYIVVNATSNGMLAQAYNFAFQRAKKCNKKWLLLFDQDTIVSQDYFSVLTKQLSSITNNDIVSLVPFLKQNNKTLSPEITNRNIWIQKPVEEYGIYQHCRISAFNSLSLINIDFLEYIGGFNDKYPLDMLDHWLYSQIYKHKKQVLVLPVVISHDLSLLDYKKNISKVRHSIFLDAEKQFVKEELTLTHYLSYKIRLLIRFLKQMITVRDIEYSKITLKKLLNIK